MRISEYNINYENLDLDQVEVLKKQISGGNDIPIRYYKKDGEEHIIDGGHTFTAYQQLNKTPLYLIEVKFTTPEDMIALSRRCNVNRIQQSPVSYAESIVKEVKGRLKIEDKDVKSVFIKYEHIKDRGDKDGADVRTILDMIFDKEEGEKSVHTFRLDYLPLLNLPEEIKQDVNKGVISKSAACEVAKVDDKEKQKQIANIVKDEELTAKMTKKVVKRVVEKDESPERAVYNVTQEKANEEYIKAKNKDSKDSKEEQMEIPLPKGEFDIIYADPPWKYDFSISTSRAIESHYPTMETEAICNMNIPDIGTGVLFLWATAPKLKEALEVMDSWGYTYKTHMIWKKDKIGMGYYARSIHELLLIGTKGLPELSDPSSRPASVIESPRENHSKKPDKFYEIIEKMYPNSKYLELFARNKRNGWISWGDEI